MTRDTTTIQVPMTTKILHNIYFHNYWLTATLGMQYTATPQYNSYIIQSFTITGFHGAYTRTSMASGVISRHTLKTAIQSHAYINLQHYIILQIKYSRVEARWSLTMPITKQTISNTQTCSLRN